jgi:hypothetical protein
MLQLQNMTGHNLKLEETSEEHFDKMKKAGRKITVMTILNCIYD